MRAVGPGRTALQGSLGVGWGMTMDPVTVAIGAAAIALGLYTAIARHWAPHHFRKLGPMKERWGEKAGTAMHVIAYTLLPLAFGIVVTIRGLNGDPLFP